MKKYSIVNASEMFISLANQLPENLVINSASSQGPLVKNLLLQFNEKHFADLKEASKYIKEPFFLEIFTVPEKDLGKKCPIEMKTAVDLPSEVVKVLFNGSTCPLVQKYAGPNRYVTVTLVTK